MRNQEKPDHKKGRGKKPISFPGKQNRGLAAWRRLRSSGEKREAQQGVFSRILVPVAFVAIVIYLIFAAWEGIRDPYTFVMAYEGTIESGLRSTGWVVRAEFPVQAGDGMVQLQLTEGEKVGKDQPIATVYQSEEYQQNQEELTQTQVDLTALQYATYEGSPTGSALDEQLLSSMKELRMAGSSGSSSDISGKADTFRKLILRREFLVSGEAVDEMTQASTDLYAKMEELQSAQTGSEVLTAPESGIFCTNLDGYETLLTPDGLDGIMPEDLKNYAALETEADPSCIGKLITSWRWYYAVSVTAEEAEQFSVGTKVDIQFDSLPTAMPMTVSSISENQNDSAVVVLYSAENLNEIKDLRQESCEIIFRSDSGLIVPKEALRILEDGSTVVYSVSGYLASVKPVTVLAENESSYVVESDSSDGTEILRPGDEVILASAEIYDGKVVR